MLVCVFGGHQVMTFMPAISKRAHELPSRSFEELSEGDRLRRDCYLVSHLSVFCNTICCLSTQTAQSRLHELLPPPPPRSQPCCPRVTIALHQFFRIRAAVLLALLYMVRTRHL